MANRHLSRSIVLQSLFEWDFSRGVNDHRLILKRNKEEFAPGLEDELFAEHLMQGIVEKEDDLDKVIEKAAPDWPIDKISVVDRNILRIGLYELLFADRDQVPPKVAINESIELSKTYGGETSSKFVNGVLGAVYKEIGEPGKEQKTKKIKNRDLPDDQVPVEELGGAVVYSLHKDDLYIALVHDVFGHWTLTKGHVDEGEKTQDAIVREIKEELGLDSVIEDGLGENAYIAYDPEKGKIKKRVAYHLAKSEYIDIVLPKKGGLDDAQWFKLKDIGDLNFYDDILPIVTKAVNILASKK